MLLLSAGTFSNADFSSSILRFSAGFQLSCPTDDRKKAGVIFHFWKRVGCIFLTSEKGWVHFWLLEKEQGAEPSEKRKTWALCILRRLKQNFKLIFYSFIFLFSVKNQRTKQAFCKTNITWNTNDAQLNISGGRWLVHAPMQVQCFVLPVLPDLLFWLHLPNFIVRRWTFLTTLIEKI